MKRVITLIILLWVLILTSAQAQIVSIGCGEYQTCYLHADGTVTVATQQYFNPSVPPTMAAFSIDSIKGVDGGQYGTVAWDSAGKVFELFSAAGYPLSASMVGNDENGDPFTDNRNVACIYRAFISIRGEDSTLWYWGIGDPLNYNSGSTITAPVALTMPEGKKIKKIRGVGNTGLNNGLTAAYGLATDGTLWKWARGTSTPSQVTGMDALTDFECTGFYAVVAVTESKIYGFGQWDSRYVGASTHSTTPVDITTRWTSQGLQFPIKQLSGNTHSLHIIDANNDLYGSGSNSMGLVGNGSAYTPLRPTWQVDISENSAMLVSPVKLDGAKVKNLQKGQTIAFYQYAQDMQGNWYAMGRNKTMSLGNGITLPPYGDAGYDSYPNAIDWTYFKNVDLENIEWEIIDFDPNDSMPPFVSANIDQLIEGDAATLYGVAFQQEHQIASVEWTKVSGADATIESPDAETTNVTGLLAGEYVFRFSATNTYGQTSTDDIKITVSGSTAPPSNRIICPCIIKQ